MDRVLSVWILANACEAIMRAFEDKKYPHDDNLGCCIDRVLQYGVDTDSLVLNNTLLHFLAYALTSSLYIIAFFKVAKIYEDPLACADVNNPNGNICDCKLGDISDGMYFEFVKVLRCHKPDLSQIDG